MNLTLDNAKIFSNHHNNFVGLMYAKCVFSLSSVQDILISSWWSSYQTNLPACTTLKAKNNDTKELSNAADSF